VQAAGTPLLEFDDGGDQAISSPEIGERDDRAFGMLFAQLGVALFEPFQENGAAGNVAGGIARRDPMALGSII
jgi:hypothetical protein